MVGSGYQEVSSRSWFSRLAGSVTGMLVGLLVVVLAIGVLWWNEGRAIKRARALNEGLAQVVEVSSERVDAANQGRLVHLSGRAETDDILSDPVFGLAEPALKMRRLVEMYQWRERSQSETREKLGGGTETVTTYSYETGWEPRLINSSNFKQPEGRTNPTRMPYEDWSQTASRVSLGAFRLSSAQLAGLGDFRRLPLTDTTPDLRLPPEARLAGSDIYLGANPSAPRVGDTRIAIEVVDPREISLVAVQQGDSFVPYRASNGNEISLLQSGVHSAQAMFESAQDANRSLTWMVRVGGFVGVFIGFTMVFGTLRVLAAVIPALGRLVGGAIGLIAGILAGAISLITIALAWVFYRPLLGGALLLFGLALLFGLKWARQAKTTDGSSALDRAEQPPSALQHRKVNQ